VIKRHILAATARRGGLRATISFINGCATIIASGDKGYGKKDCKQEIPGHSRQARTGAGNDSSRQNLSERSNSKRKDMGKRDRLDQ